MKNIFILLLCMAFAHAIQASPTQGNAREQTSVMAMLRNREAGSGITSVQKNLVKSNLTLLYREKCGNNRPADEPIERKAFIQRLREFLDIRKRAAPQYFFQTEFKNNFYRQTANTCFRLLQIAHVPARLDETAYVIPSIDAMEHGLVAFVDGLPNRYLMYRWLATVPLHWTIKAYPEIGSMANSTQLNPQRDALLEKIVAHVGPSLIFDYLYTSGSSNPDCLREEHIYTGLLVRYAVHYGDPQKVELFLRLGANPKFANENGKTAADLVREKMKNPAHQSQRPQLETILGLLEFYTNLSRT